VVADTPTAVYFEGILYHLNRAYILICSA